MMSVGDDCSVASDTGKPANSSSALARSRNDTSLGSPSAAVPEFNSAVNCAAGSPGGVASGFCKNLVASAIPCCQPLLNASESCAGLTSENNPNVVGTSASPGLQPSVM